MHRQIVKGISMAVVMVAMFVSTMAVAQEEIPPPTGKGRVVIVLSGVAGSATYRPIATRIASLGYDVMLIDSNSLTKQGGGRGDALRAAIVKARQMPNAIPGKVAIVGFSIGGGIALGLGSMWNDDVAVVAAWYPTTSDFKDAKAFASRIKVPIVMFAGVADPGPCCLVAKAHELENAAKGANAPFELTTYPGVKHNFLIPGSAFDSKAAEDAFAKTSAALKRYLGG
jgi:dienelactone hydrolase